MFNEFVQKVCCFFILINIDENVSVKNLILILEPVKKKMKVKFISFFFLIIIKPKKVVFFLNLV